MKAFLFIITLLWLSPSAWSAYTYQAHPVATEESSQREPRQPKFLTAEPQRQSPSPYPEIKGSEVAKKDTPSNWQFSYGISSSSCL